MCNALQHAAHRGSHYESCKHTAPDAVRAEINCALHADSAPAYMHRPPVLAASKQRCNRSAGNTATSTAGAHSPLLTWVVKLSLQVIHLRPSGPYVPLGQGSVVRMTAPAGPVLRTGLYPGFARSQAVPELEATPAVLMPFGQEVHVEALLMPSL